MSKNEIKQWLRNEFSNGYVLGRKFSRNINYNQSADGIISELTDRVISHGYLAKLETAIKNQM